jgi:drug/metabolite transporter (DMT)-like permease
VAAVAFGLLAALSWGAGALVSVAQVRLLGSLGSLVWMMGFGLLVALAVGLSAPVPDAPAVAWAYAASSGAGYVLATGMWLLAVRSERVSLVTPIVSTDGALAAVIAIAAYGETIGAAVAVALAAIVLGIVVTGIRQEDRGHAALSARGLLLALGASAGYGWSFVAGGEAAVLGIPWTLLTARLGATALLAPLVLATPRARARPRGWLLVLPLGLALLDIAGYAAFLRGSHSSVAIASVLASQYAIVAVVGGYLVYRERLSRLQFAGVAVTLAGVGALAILRAG